MATTQTQNGARPNIPAGYVEQTSDIVGFWDGEMPIHFIPRFVRMFDNKIDPNKTSTLLIGELVDAMNVLDSDQNQVLANKGAKVGVWTKAGMVALKDLGGIPVYMYPDGEKDVGKPSAMKLFKIMSKTKGAKLPVEGDFRKNSRPAVTPTASSPVTDDNVPF